MSKVRALSVALALSWGMSVVGCTQSPEPSQSAQTSPPAGAPVAQSSQSSQPATSAARTDIYHVHFTKAAPGQAAELAKIVSVQDPKAPMPGHILVLRHQEGDDWDFAVIEHLGTSTTLDIATFPPPGPATPLRAWHNDTFAAGPAWPEFATAMGLPGGSSGNTANSVYVASVFQAAPGHRDQLEKALAPDPAAKVPVGSVMLQHLEGGTWNYLTLQRFNSWQDFATSQTATAAASPDGWFDVRQHVAEHHDTLADRIATK